MENQASPDDQIEAAQILDLVQELMIWVVSKSEQYTPRQVATAILFAGGKVTELHILDRTDADQFIDASVQLGRNEAIRSLKTVAQERQRGID